MGKRKTQAASMGKTIIRDRFRGKKDHAKGSYLHTTDLNDGYDWGRLNLRSVTEQSNLEEFLMTAELANTEFVAEKLNVQIVTPQQRTGLLSSSELDEVKAVQEKHKELLCIPRRPAWDESTTPDELDRAERESFVEWLHQLSRLKEKKHVELTPYEVNLEFWRQLWRVIEMSDVVVQIVDARNPLLFWCPDLDKYVKEVDSSKVTAILINKADYLTNRQRQAWADYFSGLGVKVVFFSALEETKKLEEAKRQQKVSHMQPWPENAGKEEAQESETESEDDNRDGDAAADAENNDGGNDEEDDDDNQEDSDATAGSSCAVTATSHQTESQTDGQSADQTKQEDAAVPKDILSIHQEEVCGTNAEVGEEGQETTAASLGKKDRDTTLDCPVQTTEELLEIVRSMAQTQYKTGVTTIGMVGYPNVGKSSTMNAILKTKKVPVSATPGRTKTYQTVYMDKDLMLCDCPGLVFPSFVDTKSDQVVNGILSIDQLRDHIGPVSLVCERMPRELLEMTYGINLPLPADWEGEHRPPTAYELLNTYGYMRGYMTQSGNPDCPRTARYILKDYVNGKLLFCNPPPGIDAAAFQMPPYTDRKLVSRKRGAEQAQFSSKMSASRLDKEFFAKMTMRGHAQGPRAVHNYERSEGLRPIGSSGQGEGQGSASLTPFSSQQSLSGKPWKRHNNRNKREKLKRVYAEHDKN